MDGIVSVVPLGDLPTWIQAVSSTLALVGAGIAVWQTFRIHRLESERDDRARAAQEERDNLARRAQAGLVSAWWGYSSGDGQGEAPGWGAFVRNASELPVFKATVTIVNRTSAELAESFNLPAIPPAGQPVFHRLDTAPENDDQVFDYRVVLAFTDSSGLRWIRDQHGALHPCDGALTVLLDERRAQALSEPLGAFAASYGVKLTIRILTFLDLQPEFLAAAASGDSPDLVVGVHDWVGNLRGHDAIDPVELSSERLADFDPRALAALTQDGRLWGVPYAIENLALFRNTDLAPDAPSTVEELIAQGDALIDAGQALRTLALPMGIDGDAYHIYPLFSAAGGDLLRQTDSGTEVMLDSPESVAAFEKIRSLGDTGKRLLIRSMGHDNAIPMFATGKAPFLISGPWALTQIRDSRVRYEVSPIPRFAGGTAVPAPLIGVQAAMLAKGGRNRELARHALTEVLCRTDVAALIYQAEPRPPARRGVSGVDSDTPRFLEAGQEGHFIPSGGPMINVFAVFGRAIAAVVGGAPAEPTARAAAREVRALLRENVPGQRVGG